MPHGIHWNRLFFTSIQKCLDILPFQALLLRSIIPDVRTRTLASSKHVYLKASSRQGEMEAEKSLAPLGGQGDEEEAWGIGEEPQGGSVGFPEGCALSCLYSRTDLRSRLLFPRREWSPWIGDTPGTYGSACFVTLGGNSTLHRGQ